MARKKDPLEKVDEFPRRAAKYAPIAAALTEVYGELDWSRNQDGMDELISCILSQSTNDTNRDRGFARLKEAFPDWEAVRFADLDQLKEAIRPAGLANQKAPRIQAVLGVIYEEVGDYNIDFLDEIPLDEAKAWLVSLKGIGPKTAAIVLCFAYNRPAFPVDTHIFRVSKRIGFLPAKLSADDAHPVMEAIAPAATTINFTSSSFSTGATPATRARPPASAALSARTATFSPKRRARVEARSTKGKADLKADAPTESHVIISPHFDDGVFSCGGLAHQLRAAGHSVIVMTMMGGLFQGVLPDTPILADLHRRWEAGVDPLRTRQIEDERAARALDVDIMHVPIPDCVYRAAGDLALYPSEESLFGEVHPADYAPRLLAGIQIPGLETAARVYLPLGVGHHVDHQIARDWGMTQVRDAPDLSVVRFYVEFPYSKEDRSTEAALSAVSLALAPADVRLGEADIRAKIEAIACYQSQISTFWEGRAEMDADVRRAFRDPESGGYIERLWKIAG